MKPVIYLALLLLCCLASCSSTDSVVPDPDPILVVADAPTGPFRLEYGEDPLQFGDLRMPEGDGPFPVIMIIHGGCWLSSYDYTLMDSMSHDLTARGFATWNVEYRRTGDPGGAWPGTFRDVAEGLKFLIEIEQEHNIDLDRILVTGHSAGGHLALMLGAQANLDASSALKVEGLPVIKGIVSLAGITDLATYYSPSGCGSNADDLVGGLPDELPERYAEGSPISHLPLKVPQVLINGEKDNIVSVEHITPYFMRAQARNDQIELVVVPGAGHFEVITPGSIAWDAITAAFDSLAR